MKWRGLLATQEHLVVETSKPRVCAGNLSQEQRSHSRLSQNSKQPFFWVPWLSPRQIPLSVFSVWIFAVSLGIVLLKDCLSIQNSCASAFLLQTPALVKKKKKTENKQATKMCIWQSTLSQQLPLVLLPWQQWSFHSLSDHVLGDGTNKRLMLAGIVGANVNCYKEEVKINNRKLIAINISQQKPSPAKSQQTKNQKGLIPVHLYKEVYQVVKYKCKCHDKFAFRMQPHTRRASQRDRVKVLLNTSHPVGDPVNCVPSISGRVTWIL